MLNFLNLFKISKILKLFLFFSFTFNLMISNGYSYVLLVNAVDETTSIFKTDSRYVVLAKTVKKDVAKMVAVNKNMFNIAGLVDSLFEVKVPNTRNEENKAELNIKKINNLFVSMAECFYIFSLSDCIANLKLKDIDKKLNEKYISSNIINNREFDNNKTLVYDSIKELFIVQNIENHSKVFLNVLNRLSIL